MDQLEKQLEQQHGMIHVIFEDGQFRWVVSIFRAWLRAWARVRGIRASADVICQRRIWDLNLTFASFFAGKISAWRFR